MKTLFIGGFLLLIIINLGAGLWYLLIDKGQTDRTVKALTRRIILSISLIALLTLGYFTGIIHPHGVIPGQ
ncbi:MAG: DUF2909 domain-containing protein [bacterium]